jgi:predicted NBD/HSP70 family sugar kinase
MVKTKDSILNFSNMKHTNRRLVLKLLYKNGRMSRVDITRKLKCDGTTITRIIRDLLKEDLVRLAGRAESDKGRPKEFISLNPDSRQMIGLSFEPPYVTGIVSNLTGNISFCEKIHLSIDVSSGDLIDIVKGLAARLIQRTNNGKLLGIGVATFGVFYAREQKVVSSNYFPAIKDIDFCGLIGGEFGVNPEIIDSSYAKALAEMNFSGHRRKDFMLLDIGAGIGLINVRGGVPEISSSGYIGEFGHTIISRQGDACSCGRRGCLETLASISAIEKKVSAALGQKAVTFDRIAVMYAEGEHNVTKIVNDSAIALGMAVGNMATALPTSEIIFTGRLMKLGDSYFAELEKSIRETAFPIFMENTKISKSEGTDENAALGACFLILSSFFEEPTQS